ncbi:MAG: hypothetical protein ALECFALPRED_002420 [Alectoria fallacina]|uniref:Uncharacterized protein n=1 Tax=Alectoria fallacina TaxID=1903189 RepID=A0A8H3EPD7_9LECA|nr:MAG: hypothetical protein ALECFALPRED_002420 [Alectoria fallacina]
MKPINPPAISHPRTSTLPTPPSTLSISVATLLALTLALICTPLPSGFTSLGLLGLAGIVGGIYIVTTSIAESDAIEEAWKRQRRESVMVDHSDDVALLSAYGQKRLGASIRSARWICAGGGFGDLYAGATD